MSRRLFCTGALIVSAAVAFLAGAAPVRPAKPDPSPAAALYRRADFPGWEDPKITLSDALDHLSSLYGVNFEVNEKAFKFEMVDDVLKKEIANPPIPAMKNAKLESVLNRLLKRIVVNSGANYLVRNDAIEITTGLFREAEVWGTGNAPHLPLVHRNFDRVPLAEVLRELSELTEFNVVLDVRTGDKGKTPITAHFLNAPLDTAIRFLADMAELQSFQQDNLLYVTTKDNADAWDARCQKERKLELEGDPSVPGVRSPRIGTGRGGVTVINNAS